jgi:hypothetical protein
LLRGERERERRDKYDGDGEERAAEANREYPILILLRFYLCNITKHSICRYHDTAVHSVQTSHGAPLPDLLKANLLSPIALSFALGVVAKLLRSELTFPREIYVGLSLYLLFALGLHGGVELSHTPLHDIFAPAGVTLLLGVLTPVIAYATLRKFGRFSISDSAGVAAHYGSVSAVTFIAANEFVTGMGLTVEGFMPTLLTLLESPGIHIALGIGAIELGRVKNRNAANGRTGTTSRLGPDGLVLTGSGTPHGNVDWKETLREILTARTMVLLVGGLIIGFLFGDRGWKQVGAFYDTASPTFRGALCLFILEMGLVAGERMGDLKKVGAFLLGFGIVMPIIFGGLGVLLGHFAGLSVGGCTVLAAMASSASYIAAPPAVRMNLPEANPSYSLTLALAITFPFNLLAGIPLYQRMAEHLAR